MAALTIRNLDDKIKQALRLRAAKHGVSMEQEVRLILDREFSVEDASDSGKSENWYRAIRKMVKPFGGFDLEIPPRSKQLRDPPTFD